MATNGTLDGGDVLLYADSVAIAYSTGVNINFTNTLREAPHKDDGGWTERAGGRLNVSGSCNVWVAFNDGGGTPIENMDSIWTLILNGTEVDLEISNGVTGDYEWSGPALIEGMNLSFGNIGETAEGDFSFQSNGAWTQAAIT